MTRLFYASSPREVFASSAPSLAIFGWIGWSRPHGAIEVVACLVSGVLVWTFFEYWLHRGLFHARPDSPWLPATLLRVHVDHHHDPTEPKVLNAGPAIAVPVTAVCFGAAQAVLRDLSLASLYMLGMMAGYLFYELVHYEVHAGRCRVAVFKRLRRSHLYHHRVRHDANLGVSSRFWDHVFRTTREARCRGRAPTTQVGTSRPHSVA